MRRDPATSRLRRLLAGGLVLAPGACDAFTARLIERSGFGEALYLGGNALGLALAKGQPLVTLTETVMQAAAIVRTSDMPLIVDAGAGFGDPPHVHRAVRELECAGVAAIHIDDQPYPKSPGYHRGRGGMVAIEIMTARLRAAAEARRDPDLLLIARTDALRVGGAMDEAIARARACRDAGADAVMVLDAGPDEARVLAAALPDAPLVWIGGVVPPVPDSAALAAAGFALALYPFNTIAAIAEAVSHLWGQAKATGAIAQPDALLLRMRGELAEIAGMPAYWAMEDRADPSPDAGPDAAPDAAPAEATRR